MSSLYELTGNVLLLQEMLEHSTDYDEQALKDTLEAVEGEYDYKMEAYCKVIKNLETDIDGIKKEVERLTEKRKTLENNIDRLKASMFGSMKATGLTKVKGDLFTVAIQKNGGKLPVILDVEPEELPEELVKVKLEPNMDAIRIHLDKLGDLTSNFAHYAERGESLRIK